MKTKTTLKHLFLFTVLIIFQSKINAQFYIPGNSDTTIYQLHDAFFSGYTPSPLDSNEDSPFAEFTKWYNFWEPRLAPSGSFKNAALAYSTYANSIHSTHSSSSLFCSSGTPLTDTWYEMGENNISDFQQGRVNVFNFDPFNSNIIYAGGLDGGVYRTTDAGLNWVNMGTDDQLLSLGISDILTDPVFPNVVYAATGDAQGHSSFSDGVYRTVDANDGGAAVWQHDGPWTLYSDLEYVYQLAADPNINIFLYAAADYDLATSVMSIII